MPPPAAASLDRTFQALGDPTRRAILSQLRAGKATVTELARPFAISLAAVSKHIAQLERAGLIRREVVGRKHFCHLDPSPLEQAAEFTETYRAFWEARLDALEEHLRDPRRPRRKKGNRDA